MDKIYSLSFEFVDMITSGLTLNDFIIEFLFLSSSIACFLLYLSLINLSYELTYSFGHDEY